MRQVQDWHASAALTRAPKGLHFGFDYSLNPYRGCSHACRYCYARESHQFLNLNVAEDFEKILFAKENLPTLLKHELQKIPLDRIIAVGTVTDPYQPLEGRHKLTRYAIERFAESGHGFTITTKSPLILRDLDLLSPLGVRHQVAINVSLTSLDPDWIRKLEPGTSSPRRRVEMMASLREAGIPVHLFLAPIIPGISDHQENLVALFDLARELGLSSVMTSTTRLSEPVKSYFLNFLTEVNPVLSQRIRLLYQDRDYVKKSYHDALQKRLDALYERYQLVSRGPAPEPYRREVQLGFGF